MNTESFEEQLEEMIDRHGIIPTMTAIADRFESELNDLGIVQHSHEEIRHTQKLVAFVRNWVSTAKSLDSDSTHDGIVKMIAFLTKDGE